jgi:hypothetical protein
MTQKLYDAVKSGQIRLEDLNDEGKAALRSFVSARIASNGGGDVGFDPEVSDPSLQYRAANPIAVPQEAEVYSPEGGYVAPATNSEPLWNEGDAQKVAFQALKVPYNLGFRGGPETDSVVNDLPPMPTFSKGDMQQYQESMAPQSPLGKVAGWGAEQVGLLPFYAATELAAGAGLASGAGKGLSWLSKIAPKAAPAIEKAAPYAQTFASGFGSGAPVGMMESYGAGESLPDVAKAGLESGLTFGGFNMGMKGVGSLIKKGLAPKVETRAPDVPWKPIETELPQKAMPKIPSYINPEVYAGLQKMQRPTYVNPEVWESLNRPVGAGKTKLPSMPTIAPKVSAEVRVGGSNNLTREGSISAAKNTLPDKQAPTGNPNEYVRSFTRGAAESPAVDREVKDILWWDLQTGEKGTYEGRSHKMLSDEANRLIEQNPEAALQHAMSIETLAKEPDLSVAIGIKMADHYQAKGEWQKADDTLAFVAEHVTRTGQASNAAKLLVRMSPTGMQKTFKVKLGELNKEGLEVYGPKKWKDIELLPGEKEAIGRLAVGDEAGYKALYEQIQDRIGNELPSSAMEKVNAWRHISMLLNPKTQIRNIGGNMIMLAMRRTARAVSSVLQGVTVPKEQRTQVFSIKQEYKDAARAHYEANKKDLLGVNKYNENIKLNMPNKRVFADHKVLGVNVSLEPIRKLTYKLLEKGDVPFFERAYIDRLSSYAQAKGIKDFSTLPKEAFETALKEAEQATYKDASEVASLLNKWKNPGAKANVGQKAGALALEAAVPFLKTPINIIKRGVQYSPYSVLTNISKWKNAEGVDELAKGLTGTAIMGLGYVLAKKGVLTGKADKDADVKAYNANAGNSPFSIFGKYTYDWMQPFAVPLSVGVEIYNALAKNPLELKKMDALVTQNNASKLWQIASSVTSGVTDALAASGDTVFNMSIMKGIKLLLGNPQGVSAGLANLPQQYASQFIPTLSSQIAGQVDPTVRQSYVDGNIPASIKATLLNKIPFASKTLPAKQTPYGEDVQREPNIGKRFFSQFLSPGIIATDQNVKPGIDAELRRLNKEGLKTQFPTMTPNYIDGTQKYPRINLNPAEATAYQKRTGQLTLEKFNTILNSYDYKNAVANEAKNKTVDDVKADMLAKAIADAKALAKAEIVKSKGYTK